MHYAGKLNSVKIPLQIKEPTPDNEKTLTFDVNLVHQMNNNNSSRMSNHHNNISARHPSQYQQTLTTSATPCSRTKHHIMEVGDKISSFTMVCTSRLNQCATWLCGRKQNSASDSQQQSPSDDVIQGPGPSPGSTGSCGDDSQPPPRNCYRLVMLGWVIFNFFLNFIIVIKVNIFFYKFVKSSELLIFFFFGLITFCV